MFALITFIAYLNSFNQGATKHLGKNIFDSINSIDFISFIHAAVETH